jgi:hypothetical protein
LSSVHSSGEQSRAASRDDGWRPRTESKTQERRKRDALEFDAGAG